MGIGAGGLRVKGLGVGDRSRCVGSEKVVGVWVQGRGRGWGGVTVGLTRGGRRLGDRGRGVRGR